MTLPGVKPLPVDTLGSKPTVLPPLNSHYSKVEKCDKLNKQHMDVKVITNKEGQIVRLFGDGPTRVAQAFDAKTGDLIKSTIFGKKFTQTYVKGLVP